MNLAKFVALTLFCAAFVMSETDSSLAIAAAQIEPAGIELPTGQAITLRLAERAIFAAVAGWELNDAVDSTTYPRNAADLLIVGEERVRVTGGGLAGRE